MRTAIAISCLVVALLTAGAARLRTEPRSVKRVAAPVRVAPRTVLETPSAPAASAATPSLPWFEVGPEEGDVEAAEPAPIKKQPPASALAVEEARPAPRDLNRARAQDQTERCRKFIMTMLKFELPKLNRCYVEAQRRRPHLRRDVRLSLTVTEQPDGDSRLESAELDLDDYKSPAFEKCMQRALSELLLPAVDGRVTMMIPVSLNPAEAEEAEEEDDDDDE